MMTSSTIATRYNPFLHGFGLPYRLSGSDFNLKSALKTYSVGEDKIVSTKRQFENYETACEDAPGWLMYVCANTILDRAKHVAANIMSAYSAQRRQCLWLTNLDVVKTHNFAQCQLVVIDAIFFDSSPYRRDKVYEVINYNCNVPNLSVVVIGQNTDPVAMANQLGMKPNLAVLLK